MKLNRLFRMLMITALLLAVGAVSVLAQEATPEVAPPGTQQAATAQILNVNGEEVGVATFAPADNLVLVYAEFVNLEPGFHGFHIHETGECDASAETPFSTAGGHYNPQSDVHPNHAGDLLPIYVMQDGRAALSFVTDRFTIAELLEGDGSAVMVHANRDNLAHIPDRYGVPEGSEMVPDEMTLAGGDSGDRVACGVLQETVTAG